MWISPARRTSELLNVGVDCDELDARDPGVDHPVERVQPRTADPTTR
jgi:hypothetical protein